MIDWAPKNTPAGKYLEQLALGYSQNASDPGWNVLAEVGLGANPKVKKSTGNPLLDEKKYGTVHVAIGDNIDMGGLNQSSLHFDMVSLKPEVEIDGFPIMSGGQITVNVRDWREDYRKLSTRAEWDMNTVVRLTAIDTVVDPRSLLHRIWHTGSGKICSGSGG